MGLIGSDFYTKEDKAKQLLDVLLKYVDINICQADILEPSSGYSDFIKALFNRGKYYGIDSCEINPSLDIHPKDFFELPLNSYDLVIGNPPFSKNNLSDSFWHFTKYKNCREYLDTCRFYRRCKRLRIEEGFLWKSIKHIETKQGTIAFVLPITFCLENRYKEIKRKLYDTFGTIIIYQDDDIWFYNPDRKINTRNQDCCWYIFTNSCNRKGLILRYNDKETTVGKSLFLTNNITPKRVLTKHKIGNHKLSDFAEYIPQKCLAGKELIPSNTLIHDIPDNPTHLAIVHNGKTTIGMATAIDATKERVNSNFILLKLKTKDREKIRKIIQQINTDTEYFTIFGQRMGNRSIKISEILEFPID